MSTGLSKWCGAGGWRLGAFAFPQAPAWLWLAMSAVASETYTSTSAPIQHAGVTAFEAGPEIQRCLSAARRVLRALGAHVHSEQGAWSAESWIWLPEGIRRPNPGSDSAAPGLAREAMTALQTDHARGGLDQQGLRSNYFTVHGALSANAGWHGAMNA